MLKLKNSAMLVVAGLCGYVALMTPDWKSDLVAKAGVAYKNNYTYNGLTNLTGDVLWLSTSTGGTQIWDGAVKASVSYPGSYDNTVYTYAASGDFDGDGKADILFYRASNFATMIWPGAVKANATYPGVGSSGFNIAAVCDVDGLGTVGGTPPKQDDIFWYNPTTGGTQIWSGAVKSTVSYPGAQSTVYNVAGCGDFDGDGKEDILWYNAATGGTSIWSGAVKSTATYPGAQSTLTYTIAGVGDFNADNIADVLWYNSATGGTSIWPGAVKASATFPGTGTSGFVISEVADFNGDGSSDILWTNSTTNGTQVWPSAVKASVTFPGASAAGFTAQK